MLVLVTILPLRFDIDNWKISTVRSNGQPTSKNLVLLKIKDWVFHCTLLIPRRFLDKEAACQLLFSSRGFRMTRVWFRIPQSWILHHQIPRHTDTVMQPFMEPKSALIAAPLKIRLESPHAQPCWRLPMNAHYTLPVLAI